MDGSPVGVGDSTLSRRVTNHRSYPNIEGVVFDRRTEKIDLAQTVGAFNKTSNLSRYI